MLIISGPVCSSSSQNIPSGRFLLCAVMRIWTTSVGLIYLSISTSISKPAPALKKQKENVIFSLKQVCAKTKQINFGIIKRYLLPSQECWQLEAAFHSHHTDIFQRSNRTNGIGNSDMLLDLFSKKRLQRRSTWLNWICKMEYMTLVKSKRLKMLTKVRSGEILKIMWWR